MNSNVEKIGVILLLPAEVDNKMRELSKQLNQGVEPIIQLGNMPRAHITLVHVYTEEKYITDILEYLSEKSNAIKPLPLACGRLKEIVVKGVKNTAIAAVNNTPQLQQLHEEVTKKLLSFNMKLTEHQEKFSFNNYFPHITLAFGSKNEVSLEKPIDFVADTIALCRMGHHGTCQEIIKSWKLND